MAEAEAAQEEGGEELQQLSPENEKLIKEAKESYLNVLQPKLVSQFIAWMTKRDIRIENKVLGRGLNGVALAGSRPNRKKTDQGRFLRDSYGRRLREPLVIKWTAGLNFMSQTDLTNQILKTLIREMYFCTLVSHAYLVTAHYRIGPVVPDHGMTPQLQDPECGFDASMQPTGGFYMI